MYDVIVVGLGPSGGRVSANLSSMGYKVLALDLKSEIGIPNHCSGLVDERVVKIVGFDLVIDRPEEAEIITPISNTTISSKKMFVIDRVALDKKIASISEANGTEILLKTKFLNYSYTKDGVKIYTTGINGFQEYETKYLVGSDGPLSQVRNISKIKPPKILPSVQFDVAEKTNRVKLYLNRRVTPEFFSWEIPHNNETEIGASGKGAYETVKNLAQMRKIIRKRGGAIPVGPTDLGTRNIFLTGDSAGLNKATTGGGLYAAIKSSDSLSESFKTGGNILNTYRNKWISNFGNEINRDFELRLLFDKFEKYYNLWVPILISNVNGINIVGDVDYPSKILLYLMGASPLNIGKIIKNIILLSNQSHNYSK